jgi:membrane-bound lytic murein transglycosylase F
MENSRIALHKYLIICFLAVITVLFACNSGDRRDQKSRIKRDLVEMKEDSVLKAITIFSPTSYFLYRGQPMGFEYDLLQRLAEHLELKLQIVVADNMDDMFYMLNRGEGDIIAYGLTVTEPRKKIVDFTLHHFESHQVLVQRKPDNWRKMKLHNIEKELIRNPIDLIGQTVHVRKGSSYYERLMNLSQEIGGEIIISPIEGSLTTDEIIQMVVDGEIDYTVADYNIAAVNKTYHPILDIETAISFSQRIAWAVRKNSPELLDEVNQWIEGMKKTTDYYVIYNKYFKNKKLYRKRIASEFHSETSGKISQYDRLIRELAQPLEWDWRLLSSVVYQESRFDPQATSWAGGEGLMQIMPATAEELGLEDSFDPEQNLEAGIAYLQQLWDRWDQIPDETQRIKFTLASYNCGYHHVVDAQKLASKYNADPEIWDNEVEDFLLKLSHPRFYRDEVVDYGYVRGMEPYEYVREIFERYEHYKKLIPMDDSSLDTSMER